MDGLIMNPDNGSNGSNGDNGDNGDKEGYLGIWSMEGISALVVLASAFMRR